MAHRTPAQLANRRRVETVIGVVAPVLDLILFAGERVARVAGRNDPDVEPPRLARRRVRTSLDGPADAAGPRG